MTASLLADRRVERVVSRIVRNNRLPPPPTLYGRIQNALVRPKHRLQRHFRDGGIGNKLMGSFLVVLTLLIWAHVFALTYCQLRFKRLMPLFEEPLRHFGNNYIDMSEFPMGTVLNLDLHLSRSDLAQDRNKCDKSA